MTVAENIDMGAYVRTDRRTPEFAADLERVYELFPRLAERRTQVGGTLSGGEQQMLAIGRALMAQARACCCSTSRRWASRRSSSPRSSG